LEDICENVGMQPTKHKSSQPNPDNLRKCLLTGFFNNIAEQKVHDKHYIVLSNRQKAQIHPSSILSGYHGLIAKNGNGISITSDNNKIKDASKSNFVIFNEVVETSQVYLRTVTKIEPEWIEEFMAMKNSSSS
jgi:ATP-dependent RNA helicase DHX33